MCGRQVHRRYSRPGRRIESNAMQEPHRRKGSDTRQAILDVAEAAILDNGFAATSIDELIAAVGITKSGFFYHFKDKGELAKALLVRYVEREDMLFDDLFRRAEELDEDPLHGFLVGLKMLSEMMADLPAGHPGCLVAAYCYQDRLFDREVRGLYTSAAISIAAGLDRGALSAAHSRRSRLSRRHALGNHRGWHHRLQGRQ